MNHCNLLPGIGDHSQPFLQRSDFLDNCLQKEGTPDQLTHLNGSTDMFFKSLLEKHSTNSVEHYDPEEFFPEQPHNRGRYAAPIQIMDGLDHLSDSYHGDLDELDLHDQPTPLFRPEPVIIEEGPREQPQRFSRRCRVPKYRLDYHKFADDSSDSFNPRSKRVAGNETKNIPKNYGKAVISFIERNRDKVEELLQDSAASYDDLLQEFKTRKKFINTIADLRNLWTDGKYSREMRILSNLFLRKHALQYIFNSRVTNYSSHIKYRMKLRDALRDPTGFRNIKDY